MTIFNIIHNEKNPHTYTHTCAVLSCSFAKENGQLSVKKILRTKEKIKKHKNRKQKKTTQQIYQQVTLFAKCKSSTPSFNMNQEVNIF